MAPAAACPAANCIAARAVISHREDETDAEADRDCQCRDKGRRRQATRRGASARGGACRTPGPAGYAPCRPDIAAGAPPRRGSGPRSSRARPASEMAAAGGRSRCRGSRLAREPEAFVRPVGTDGSISMHEPDRERLIMAASSFLRRRAIWTRALRAVRRATPYSQFPSRSGSRIDRALRARTRKTAWKASSASCGSPSTCRQMSRTIGPCRLTRAAKAASPAASRRAVNRSMSWRSVNPATEPPSKSDPICRDDR